jgi:hypothetical protein
MVGLRLQELLGQRVGRFKLKAQLLRLMRHLALPDPPNRPAEQRHVFVLAQEQPELEALGIQAGGVGAQDLQATFTDVDHHAAALLGQHLGLEDPDRPGLMLGRHQEELDARKAALVGMGKDGTHDGLAPWMK